MVDWTGQAQSRVVGVGESFEVTGNEVGRDRESKKGNERVEEGEGNVMMIACRGGGYGIGLSRIVEGLIYNELQ